jgi:hypothetical protein
MNKQKITIERKYRGSIEIPDTKDAKDIFFRVKQAYANHEKMSTKLVFSNYDLKRLKTYIKGAAAEELKNLDFYLALGEILKFNTDDAQKLKNSILFINDNAHTKFNITKRIKLINKKRKSKTDKSYLFWDIENFSNISSIFNDIIEPFEIDDRDIYLAANPDSLYLKKNEWEANLYDYGKTLHSFNFIKCDHGKNVADDILLEEFNRLKLKNSDVYILTFDRELKERFTQITNPSNNLFIMGK